MRGLGWDRLGATGQGAVAGALVTVAVLVAGLLTATFVFPGSLQALLGVSRLADTGPVRSSPPAGGPGPTSSAPGGTSSAGTSTGPAAPTGWQSMVALVRDGVARIDASSSCTPDSVGSGALVGPDLVLTAAHVVRHSSSLDVAVGNQHRRGTVVGLQNDADLALVALSSPVTGHVFTLAPTDPEVGTDVVALGYALGGQLALAGPGLVSAQGEDTYQVDEVTGRHYDIAGMLRTTLPTNPGNSGGPVLDAQGRIVAVVSGSAPSTAVLGDSGQIDLSVPSGIKYDTPASTVAPLLARWSTARHPVPVDDCSTSSPTSTSPPAVSVRVVPGGALAEEVGALFQQYATAVNAQDIDRAFDLHATAWRDSQDRAAFRQGMKTSSYSDVRVLSVDKAADGSVTARVTFRTHQDAQWGPNGLVCSDWYLQYTLVRQDGGLRIDQSVPVPGHNAFTPCS